MERTIKPRYCACRNAWVPPDTRPVWQWAAQHVSLPASYAKPGRFSIDTSRYLMDPLKASTDDLSREVTCAGAIQTGKTLVVELAALWAMVNSPGPIMWTLQTDEDAKEHWKQRFLELLRSTKPVAAILPGGHDFKTGSIYFGPFFLEVNGANLNNLQRVSVRWKFNSEVWLWKEGLLEHARGRVSAFERAGTSKVVNESQGGVAGDDFDRAWQAGDQCLWHIRCEGCRQHVPLSFFQHAADEPQTFAGVVWDSEARDDNGDWIVSRCAETARFRCPKCGHEHDDSARTHARWNAEGKYIAQRTDAPPSIRSFRWESLVARDMAALVAQWTEACNQKRRGVIQGVKDFYQKRCALAWSEDTQDFAEAVEVAPGEYTLEDVTKQPAAKIDGEAHRFLCIDRQRDHFWAIVRAWRADGSSRLLWCGKVLTPEQLRDIQQTFAVPDKLTFEDAQHDTSGVYTDCVRFGWTALHGSGRNSFTHILQNGAKVQRFYSPTAHAQHGGGLVRYYHWASDPVKDILHRLWSGHGAAFEYPADAPDFYRQHMGGEVKKERVNKTTNRLEFRWIKRSAVPNHLRDCEAMSVAAALMLKLLAAEKHEAPEKPADHTAS